MARTHGPQGRVSRRWRLTHFVKFKLQKNAKKTGKNLKLRLFSGFSCFFFKNCGFFSIFCENVKLARFTRSKFLISTHYSIVFPWNWPFILAETGVSRHIPNFKLHITDGTSELAAVLTPAVDGVPSPNCFLFSLKVTFSARSPIYRPLSDDFQLPIFFHNIPWI